MKHLIVAIAVSGAAAASASAQDAPKFFSETYPEHAFEEAMNLYAALGNEEAALDAKTRELVALAVGAQIPCSYCVYSHKKQAAAAGASDAEIREAVAIAANVRMWSTVLNGMGYDLDAFKAEHDEMVPPTN